ncbi:NCS2 family permease [Phosphitispora fastidiosa]|uniref:NCS2 family permease n=1 Tax=Phosphitispora fastidiosa TaxID=2837202 RepID=UPI001E3BB047|nr:NCS2 family permease [Phosphitispora fastidiosa]MBU7008518.1 AGZA family xanthine/uracil permease-like MFS transporter [Phosphitispora fastidiosa]
MIERLFRFRELGTDVKTEVIAGLTTFMTMAYILAVNPIILSGAGMDYNAVFIATALAAGVVTIAMGLFVNFPIALAPGMGLNAYFAAIVASGQMSWQVALGAVFLSGVIFIILTVTNIRQLLVEAVPNSLKKAITVGIGLFITSIGLKLSGLAVVFIELLPGEFGGSFENIAKAGKGVITPSEWASKLGIISEGPALLAIIGLLLSGLLLAKKVKGSLLWGIIITTLAGIPLGVTDLEGFSYSFPSFQNLAVGRLDIMGALQAGLLTVILTFTFVELFDTFGTLIGTAGKAGLLDEKGNNPRIGRAMLVDAFGVSFGALMGTSTVTSYIESAAGIGEGGKSGLTAVTTGVMFLLAILLAPFFILIPSAATAPALILVGLLMVSAIREIDFEHMADAIPAFLTIVFMPFTANIANGISAGIITYVFLKVTTGKPREVHWLMYILFVLIALRYAFLGGE